MIKDKQLLKNIIKSFGCIILFLESSWIQRLLIAIFNIKKITVSTATILNTVSNFVFLIFIFYVYRKELKKEWAVFKRNVSDNMDVAIKYWLLGLVGMMVSNILLSLLFHSDHSTNEELVQKMIKSVPFLMIINAGIIGPINEEMLFRKCFRNVFKGKWTFILISSFVFGFMHVTTASSIGQFLYILPYTCLGISFATTYYKTKSIFPSIFMHQTHNIVLTLLSILLH